MYSIHLIVISAKKIYAPQLKYLCYFRINQKKISFQFYQDVNFNF